MFRTLLVCASLALVASAAPLVLELSVEPDENNVTAGRLSGDWEPDPTVNERLGVESRVSRLSFVADADVAARIPAKYDEFLSELQIFEAGIFTTYQNDEVQRTAPYILLQISGNPHLIWFRERDGEPLGDAESFNLIVAQGKTKAQDLLLVGGDFNNEPFRAFRRMQD